MQIIKFIKYKLKKGYIFIILSLIFFYKQLNLNFFIFQKKRKNNLNNKVINIRKIIINIKKKQNYINK